MGIEFKNTNLNELMECLKEKKFIAYGKSRLLDHILKEENSDNNSDLINSNLIAIIDHISPKRDESYCYKGREISVVGLEELSHFSNSILLITYDMYEDVLTAYKQLKNMDIQNHFICYSLRLLIQFPNIGPDNTVAESLFEKATDDIIPKRIHSFWFGGEEKPAICQKCIDSWKQKCPDYEIIEWNSDTYDVTVNKYMYQAFQKGCWAFVSDYARLDVVYRYGGIYLDMDVEVLRSLDPFLKVENFFCKGDGTIIEIGKGFGAVKESPVIKMLLSAYDDRNFIMENGELDKTPQPALLVPAFQKLGWKNSHDSELIDGKILFLSNDYFKSAMGDGTKQKWSGNETAIHWYSSSWLDKDKANTFKINRDYAAELLHIFEG